MPIVAPFPAPVTPPVTQPSPWQRTTHLWTGWDGSTWALSERATGVVLTDEGLEGLEMPPVTPYVSTSPAVAGEVWRGSRTQSREAFWPLFVWAGSSADWLKLSRGFWRTMHPDQTGVWSVTTPDGQTRSLVLRYKEMSDPTTQRDPAYQGWQKYGITLIAEQPYWLGPLSYRHFEVGEGQPFFAADHDSPPNDAVFYISPSTTLGHAAIDNPGDLDAPLVYVLDGPWDAGAWVGVGSKVTSYSAAIPSGQSVVVDMRPGDSYGAWSMATPSAEGGSSEWWRAVSSHQFGTYAFPQLGDVALNVSVQPGRSRELTVHATGQGTVHVALEPRFWRAF